MKIKIDHNISYETEPEVIIRCKEIDERVLKLLSLLDIHKKKLLGFIDQTEHIIDPWEVLYCESVDGVVFVYTQKKVYKSAYTLNDIESTFSEVGYFRCSKSMVLNIHSIKTLKFSIGYKIKQATNLAAANVDLQQPLCTYENC